VWESAFLSRLRPRHYSIETITQALNTTNTQTPPQIDIKTFESNEEPIPKKEVENHTSNEPLWLRKARETQNSEPWKQGSLATSFRKQDKGAEIQESGTISLDKVIEFLKKQSSTEVTMFDMRRLITYSDYFIIVEGLNEKHTKKLVEEFVWKVKFLFSFFFLYLKTSIKI